MSYLNIHDLKVRYGDFHALKGVSFSVAERERICLLGPSGCGKTTTLQVVAGFVTPESGEVGLAGRSLLGFAPEKRNIGIMFQNYALFPHMTVFDNVAFGLRMRNVAATEIKQQVMAALERVQLAHAAQKMPAMLSGGEQQRIAFARAVVIKPNLLLLDEPFSNLDARLRQEMRAELLELLENLPIATVMVTHDQEEAMAIADRIVVMRSGQIQQIGTPSEIYDTPASLFAARFIGDSNTFSGKVMAIDGGTVEIDIAGVGRIRGKNHGLGVGATAEVLVRPQRVRLTNRDSREPCQNAVPATIERVLFLGHRTEFHVRLANGAIFIVWTDTSLPDAQIGTAVELVWSVSDCFAFPTES
jgi:ABC-type Fe3+/spermidine/putrescine transport system ATPase subunit